jgi:hypothetical protein
MITFDTARALAAHLAATRRAVIVDPDDARPWLATLEGAVSLLPGAAPVLTTVRGLVSGAAESVAGLAVPSPWGTAILLTPRAMVDPAAYVATVTHELVHASQVVALGAGQTAADYLHPELRALREAEAGGVGLWVRYLVTGVRPSPDEAGVVRSALYHLDASDRAFGRAVVESILAPIELGAVPPHSVAREALAWLHEHAPDAIAAGAYADRATAVPQ